VKVCVGFSTHCGLFSKLIRLFTNSEVSHAYLLVDQPIGQTIIQASGLKLHATCYELFKKENLNIKLYEVDIPLYKVKWVFRQTGKRYGMWELLGYLIVLLGRKFGLSLPNLFSDGYKTFICSELIANLFELDAETTTPQDLLEYCEKYYGTNNTQENTELGS
jgi:hypothetical protein